MPAGMQALRTKPMGRVAAPALLGCAHRTAAVQLAQGSDLFQRGFVALAASAQAASVAAASVVAT